MGSCKSQLRLLSGELQVTAKAVSYKSQLRLLSGEWQVTAIIVERRVASYS